MKKWWQNLKFWYLLATILLAVIFIFLRFYKVEETTLFFGDLGRDYYHVWRLTHGDFVWLGPQNSASALSQTAFFFYLLAPIMLLTNFSIFANNLTLLIYTLLFLTAIFYLVWTRKKYRLPFLLTFLLITVSPIIILQSRNVWNPSFVWQPILLAFFLMLLPLKIKPIKKISWLKKLNFNWLFIGALLALANSFSFATFPAALAFFIILIFTNGKKSLPKIISYGSGFVLSSMVLFAPFFAFELRYNFQILKRFFGSLGGDLVRVNTLSGHVTTFDKLQQLGGIFNQPLIFYLLIIAILIYFIAMFFIKKNKKLTPKTLSAPSFYAALMLVATIILALLFPVEIHSHYLFLPLILLIVMITFFPKKPLAILISFIIVCWWSKNILAGNYWQNKVTYSLNDLKNCAARICEEHHEPLFMSAESEFYSGHQGEEFKFALAAAGCDFRDIYFEPQSADTMLVFSVGNKKFVPQISAYDELTLFGDYVATESATCANENITYTFLQQVE